MIRDRKELKDRPIEIDLSGPDGNAFVLLAYAKRYAYDLGLDGVEIQKDMMSSDYEHLVEVFDKHFGDFVILYRWGAE